MTVKRFLVGASCLLLCLLAACGTPVQESGSSEIPAPPAVSGEETESEPETSSPESAAGGTEEPPSGEQEKPVIVSAADFAWPDMEFDAYDPSSDLSYGEYFAEERLLEESAVPEKRGDIPGYRYIRGAETDESVWNDGRYYWTHSYDNLYLYQGTTGQRTLLAEVPGISRVMIFSDCLYLITDNAVWRCGRLGEDLTCVYEHPSAFSAGEQGDRNALFFVSEGEIWRLHLPSGTADKLCVIGDLPVYDKSEIGYIPYTNYAFFTFDDTGWYVFSSRTGEETRLSGEYSWESDFRQWAASVYELNRY